MTADNRTGEVTPEQVVAEALGKWGDSSDQVPIEAYMVVAALRDARMLRSVERDRFIAGKVLYETGYDTDLILQYLDVNYPQGVPE